MVSDTDDPVGRVIGSYRIDALIGAGGMGEVYKALDTKLDRPVALKLLSTDTARDPDRLRRFHAEARAASSLNHPHILVIHDFGDLDGRPFIVSEFVEGETLRDRLSRGPLAPADTLHVATQLTAALGAAHVRGIVHRDIKPENVMLRPDGYVKVLDFGLVKLMPSHAVSDADVTRTEPGRMLGTPRYMSPEQARGLETDPRSDVWSTGVLIYEMLAGRQPFVGPSTADVVAAILHTDPTPLDVHAPQVPEALARIVATALAKDPSRRYASAVEFHDALEGAGSRLEIRSAHSTPVDRRQADRVRIIALPLRILTPHPDSDFLAFSLPDAITASLAGIESVIVRSSVTAARFANTLEIERVAAEAAVDFVLSGTLLRAGDRVRVTAQLVDANRGAVIWSRSSDASLADVFALQDDLAMTIVESLSVPLTGRDRAQLQRDVPASTRGYEYYLRANELSREPKHWRLALDMYLQAIEEDRRFAPAWARLARVYRLLAKYQHGDSANLARAEEALQRALDLNPDLPFAHHLYAQIDIDRGRADEAMVRLIARASDRGVSADIFAALVHTCRVCGLMDASLAANARARGIDRDADTGVIHTLWLLHRYDDIVGYTGEAVAYVVPAALAELGRTDDAKRLIATLESRTGNRVPHLAAAVLAFIEGRHEDGVRALLAQMEAAAVPDPELLFYVGRHLAHVGEFDRAMPLIQQAVDGGYGSYPILAQDRWLDGLRPRSEFRGALAAAKVRWERAAAAFVRAGGPQLLGVSPG